MANEKGPRTARFTPRLGFLVGLVGFVYFGTLLIAAVADNNHSPIRIAGSGIFLIMAIYMMWHALKRARTPPI